MPVRRENIDPAELAAIDWNRYCMTMRTIIAAMLCCCFVALADTAPLQQRTVVAKPSPGADKSGAEKARGDQYPIENAPLPVRVIQSPSDAANSDAYEQETDKREDQNAKSQERSAEAAESQASAAWATMAITFIGTAFLLWTLYETRRSANAARDSADAFMTSERPNLVLESVMIAGLKQLPIDHPDSDEPFRPVGHCKIKNYGKSPAWIVESSFKLLMQKRLPADPLWESSEASWLDTIPPNTDIARILGLPPSDEHCGEWGQITSQQYESLKTGDLKIFFLGKVKYRDQFGKTHVVSGAWEHFVITYDQSQELDWSMLPCGPREYWEYT